MKRIISYIIFLIFGLSFIILSVFLTNQKINDLIIAIGTGLLTSALMALFIEIINKNDFQKKKKYRRKIELHYLSFSMLMMARGIINEYDNKNINDILQKLEKIKFKEDNYQRISLAIESQQKNISTQLENIRKIQDYLSLSNYFRDKEIVFLCRSINYYDKPLVKDRIKTIIENLITYLKFFRDTFC